jgi:aminoglycoside phosphotransferase (APT) family kinase protein
MDEIRSWLSAHLPDVDVSALTRLDEGAENTAYDVNGELIVRVRKPSALDPAGGSVADATRREADVLSTVGRLTRLPVPRPLRVDPERGIIVYERLPGLPLFDVVDQPSRMKDQAHLAKTLGEFLGRLHRAPLDRMRSLVPAEDAPLSAWLDEAAADYADVADIVPAEARPVIEKFLATSPPPEPRVVALCHNDLGAEHLLVDEMTSAVTGIIDWSDAALGDPALDFARIYRDVGPGFVFMTLVHYQAHWSPAEMERVVFYARCALLEDLAYSFHTGFHRYADAGLAHLDRTFA